MGQEQSIEAGNGLIQLRLSGHKHQELPSNIIKAMTETTLGYVDLSNGKWNRLEMRTYTVSISIWRVNKGLILDKNYYSRILHDINNINFPNLLELTLRNNNIESIQPINRVYMPQLERLWFCENKICYVGSLRKCYFVNLRYLSFNQNQSSDMESISELKSQHLEQFFIQITNKMFQLPSNLRWPYRLQSRKLHKIWTQIGNGIICTKTLKKLSDKYPYLDIAPVSACGQ